MLISIKSNFRLPLYTSNLHFHNPKYTIIYDKLRDRSSEWPRDRLSEQRKNQTWNLRRRLSDIIGLIIQRKPDTLAEKVEEIIKWKSSKENINVIRKHTVVSIGDLNGNYGALLWNLISTQLIDRSGNWIGKNTRVVFHWDIFADRYPDSMAIASFLTQLQTKAKLDGGEFILLAWNHEDVAFAYLTGQYIDIDGRLSTIWIDTSKQSTIWLMELESSIDPNITFEQIKSKEKTKNRDSISLLEKMRTDEKWIETLNFICRMKLIDHIDDTLRIHVMPHTTMLELIVQIWIENINALYQKWMRHYLLWEWTLTQSEKKEYMNLRQVFLNTDHRNMKEHSVYKKIKEMWINLIINGHDQTNAGKRSEFHWVICTGVDFLLWNPWSSNEKPMLRTRKLEGRKKINWAWTTVERRDPDRATSTLVLWIDGSMLYGNGDTYKI